jgi:small redox-active disulfide protein 2
MKIKILGSGCSKCKTLTENTQTALTHLGMVAEIIKVTDYAEIAAHGVMSTPALAIDDKVVSVGRVLLSAEIETLLQAR